MKEENLVELGNKDYFYIIPSGIKNFNGEKEYLSTSSIQESSIKEIECKITFDERPSRANMQPALDSVWFAKMKETKKVYSFEDSNKKEIEKFIMSTGFCGIKVNKEKVLPRYLRYYFLTPYFNKLKDSLSSGSTQKAVNSEKIKKIKIPIPSLKVQKEVVDLLDELSETMLLRETADNLTDNLIYSIFVNMFGHPSANEKKFPIKNLGLLANLNTGGTPSTKRADFYYNGTINWLKSGDIKDDFLYDVPNKITKLGLESSNAKMYKVGDVVIALNGQGKTRGTTAILKTNTSSNQSVVSISPNEELSSEYLHFNLKMRYSEIRNLTGDKERSGLNLIILKKFPIALPSKEDQKKFSRIITEIEEMKKEQKLSLKEMNTLLNSVNQRCFLVN